MSDPNSDKAKRAAYDHNIEAAKRDHDGLDRFIEQMQPLVVKDAQVTIQSVILMNGGAAVSVLAFVGALAGKGEAHMERFQGVFDSLALFAAGVATGVICASLSYLTNYCVAMSAARQEKIWEFPWSRQTAASRNWAAGATTFRSLAFIVWFGAWAAFVGGVWSIYSSISHLT
jgi:hypothetical protein